MLACVFVAGPEELWLVRSSVDSDPAPGDVATVAAPAGDGGLHRVESPRSFGIGKQARAEADALLAMEVARGIGGESE